MMEDAAQEKEPLKWRKLAVQASVGFMFGVVAGWAARYFGWVNQLHAMGPSAAVCVAIGLIYIVCGTAVSLGLFSPRLGAQLLNVADEEELLEQRPILGAAGLGMAVIGALQFVLAFSGSKGAIPPSVAVAIVLGAIVGLISISIYQLRHMDELMRLLAREATVWSYYLLLLVGGGWAALAHLEFLPSPAPLDWVSLFSAVVLMASGIAAGRLGMLKPR